MNFAEAIQSGFQNYVGFSGRAARSEFWFWVLFAVIVSFATQLLDGMIFGEEFGQFGLLSGIAALALFLPGLAVSVRRLHDRDKSGWFILLHFIPLVGFIILLIWFCMRGTVGPNRFGPDPLSAVPGLQPA
jgi:uncharacterized membrane protein YhaH (DUF805 family)